MAEILHKNLCQANHADGCSWHYESWENPGYSRNRYYRMAQQVLNKFSTTDIMDLFVMINKERY